MYLSEFWSKFGTEILLSSVFILISVALLVVLIINLGRKNTSKKMYLVGAIILALVIFAVNFTLVRDYNDKVVRDPSLVFPYAKLLLFNAFVIILFVLIGYFFVYKQKKIQRKTSTTSVATLSLMVALASVLMLFGIPIFPAASFLKVEISALIYFMIYLWFGFKPTITIIILTNLIHIIMPSITPPLVFGLDETANIVAILVFLLPSFIVFRKLPNDEAPQFRTVLITSLAGVLLTTIFMVLYNYFIFIPIYEYILDIPIEVILNTSEEFNFIATLTLFGSFNLIKWGSVAVVVSLLYRRLYVLKSQLVRE